MMWTTLEARGRFLGSAGPEVNANTANANLPHRRRLGFKALSRNVACSTWLVLQHQPKETIMLKIAALTSALAIGSVSGAYAQTGPPAQTDMNKPNMTNTNSEAVKKSGTTGMSSGGGSGMTEKGGANGTPSSMPKTTIGPTGPASNTESPAK
jgi:hypothetical protein